MPRYNLNNSQGIVNAKKNLEYHISKGNTVEQKYIRKTRSNTQNRALHLYYKLVANALLEVGYDFNYTNPITGEIIAIPYTKDLVKEYIWRPMQTTMFKIESTTKLDTFMINDILAVLTPWLGNINKLVKFPNKFDQLVEQMNNFM